MRPTHNLFDCCNTWFLSHKGLLLNGEGKTLKKERENQAVLVIINSGSLLEILCLKHGISKAPPCLVLQIAGQQDLLGQTRRRTENLGVETTHAAAPDSYQNNSEWHMSGSPHAQGDKKKRDGLRLALNLS